jgi:hypothetical protein
MIWLGAEQPRNHASIILKNVLFCKVSAVDLGPIQSCVQLETRTFCSRKKRPGREADHWLPPSVVINDESSYISISQYFLMNWQGHFCVSSNICEASKAGKLWNNELGIKQKVGKFHPFIGYKGL